MGMSERDPTQNTGPADDPSEEQSVQPTGGGRLKTGEYSEVIIAM